MKRLTNSPKLSMFSGIIAASVLLAAPATAQTQPNCSPRDEVDEFLSEQWGEVPHVVALGSNGSIVEFFANPETGTWTIVITAPNGWSCNAVDGVAFEMLIPAEGDPA